MSIYIFIMLYHMYIKKATTEDKFKQKRFDKRSLSLNRKNLKKEPLEVFCVFFRNLRCF